MKKFDSIWQRAIDRKGGAKRLQSLLPETLSNRELASQSDAYFLALMTKSVFKSGFVWRVIEKKWPQFEEAFRDFEPSRLFMLRDEDWEAYAEDTRIVRNMVKVRATRHNLNFVQDIADEHGSFGRWLAAWPDGEQVGLFLYLKKHGSRLGGMTGQYFLAASGFDTFLLTREVVHCLQLEGLDVADNPTSQRDLKKIQERFNQYHQESGLSYRHLSRVMALSVGENRL